MIVFSLPRKFGLMGTVLGLEVALVLCAQEDGEIGQYCERFPRFRRIYKFIIPDTGIYVHPEIPKDRAEVVFTLDCPTLDRLGKTQDYPQRCHNHKYRPPCFQRTFREN